MKGNIPPCYHGFGVTDVGEEGKRKGEHLLPQKA